MELPHIGLACMICNRNDYLPFKCASCSKIVCIDHRASHGDDCPLNRKSFVVNDDSKPAESLKQACDFCRKITLKLELTKCNECPGNHCLYHRHQVQHNCPKLAEDKQLRDSETKARAVRQHEALERLKSINEAPKQQTTATIPQRPVNEMNQKNRAIARRVRLMKMKQSATCPKGLVHDTSIRSDQDKLYLEVKFIHEPSSSISAASLGGKSVNIWTSPKWSIGQTIDYPAHLLGLTNKNHIEGSDTLVFKKQADTSSELIQLDSKLAFQKYLDDGEIASGDVLYITYALKPSNEM